MEKRWENEKDWQFEGRIRHCFCFFVDSSSLSPFFIYRGLKFDVVKGIEGVYWRCYGVCEYYIQDTLNNDLYLLFNYYFQYIYSTRWFLVNSKIIFFIVVAILFVLRYVIGHFFSFFYQQLVISFHFKTLNCLIHYKFMDVSIIICIYYIILGNDQNIINWVLIDFNLQRLSAEIHVLQNEQASVGIRIAYMKKNIHSLKLIYYCFFLYQKFCIVLTFYYW